MNAPTALIAVHFLQVVVESFLDYCKKDSIEFDFKNLPKHFHLSILAKHSSLIFLIIISITGIGTEKLFT